MLSLVALLHFACQSKVDEKQPDDTVKNVNLASEKSGIEHFSLPPSRNFLLSALKQDHFDVLIIGGGATGAGAALDAATRGLKVALIEAHDFSSGTSSRSTKLVHGGVRYLENAVKKLDRQEYELVRDALQERKRFLDNAPHLSNSLPILTPVYGYFEAFYFWVGLKLYDLVAGSASLGKSEFIAREDAIQRFPQLKKEGLKGAVVYYDGQFDDARMNVSIILTAIKHGAIALNYVRAEHLLKDNDRISGVMAQDMLSRQQIPIKARVVINATGPFADHIRQMDNASAKNIMIPSQGSHILLPQSFSPPHDGLIIPSTKDGRVLFLLPWMDKTLAGTTDHMEKITDAPKASNDEVEYILEHLRLYFDVPVKREDILASWSGLRPLAKPDKDAQSTAAISRDHLIEVSPSQLITIVGGKWTTYRKMAEDVIDTAIKIGSFNTKALSATKNLKLVGAERYSHALSDELIKQHNLDPSFAKHLAHSYGDKAYIILDIIDKNPHLNRKIVDKYPFRAAEVIYNIQHEYPQHAIDILSRRLRLAFLDNESALEALPKVIEIMAHYLQWDSKRRQEELELGLKFLGTMLTKPPA
jgi:glycerol-3-phosphate dehydrogenase